VLRSWTSLEGIFPTLTGKDARRFARHTEKEVADYLRAKKVYEECIKKWESNSYKKSIEN